MARSKLRPSKREYLFGKLEYWVSRFNLEPTTPSEKKKIDGIMKKLTLKVY